MSTHDPPRAENLKVALDVLEQAAHSLAGSEDALNTLAQTTIGSITRWAYYHVNANTLSRVCHLRFASHLETDQLKTAALRVRSRLRTAAKAFQTEPAILCFLFDTDVALNTICVEALHNLHGRYPDVTIGDLVDRFDAEVAKPSLTTAPGTRGRPWSSTARKAFSLVISSSLWADAKKTKGKSRPTPDPGDQSDAQSELDGEADYASIPDLSPGLVPSIEVRRGTNHTGQGNAFRRRMAHGPLSPIFERESYADISYLWQRSPSLSFDEGVPAHSSEDLALQYIPSSPQQHLPIHPTGAKLDDTNPHGSKTPEQDGVVCPIPRARIQTEPPSHPPTPPQPLTGRKRAMSTSPGTMLKAVARDDSAMFLQSPKRCRQSNALLHDFSGLIEFPGVHNPVASPASGCLKKGVRARPNLTELLPCIDRLDGESWLNDTVVNTLLHRLIRGGLGVLGSAVLQCNWAAWTTIPRLLAYEADKASLLIPVHDQYHWVLCRYIKASDTLQIYDPLQDDVACRHLVSRLVVPFLSWLMQKEAGHDIEILRASRPTNKSPPVRGPEQPNGYDCGVYIICAAEVLAQSPLSSYVSLPRAFDGSAARQRFRRIFLSSAASTAAPGTWDKQTRVGMNLTKVSRDLWIWARSMRMAAPLASLPASSTSQDPLVTSTQRFIETQCRQFSLDVTLHQVDVFQSRHIDFLRAATAKHTSTAAMESDATEAAEASRQARIFSTSLKTMLSAAQWFCDNGKNETDDAKKDSCPGQRVAILGMTAALGVNGDTMESLIQLEESRRQQVCGGYKALGAEVWQAYAQSVAHLLILRYAARRADSMAQGI
ncbi:ulp1 protease family protein [Colletotrichum tofieldiae]|nr:Ulp1 protease family protein [Colletotrichum tofieldiae]GKT69018.1 ulp1 protease family protein [Colletotrichum tofieldiae]